MRCPTCLGPEQRRGQRARTVRALGQVLLAHYSRSADVVVGTPLGNRAHPELEGLIGYFVNSAALRTDLSGAPRRSRRPLATARTPATPPAGCPPGAARARPARRAAPAATAAPPLTCARPRQARRRWRRW